MATSKLPLSFRIFKNGQLVRETQLSQGVIKIGKVASAHLHLDDEHVSRMHAIIEVVGDEVSVIDLGSTGGTFVNGQKINKAKLQSGDVIGAGDSRIEIAIGAKQAVTAAPLAVVPAVTPAATPAIVTPAPRAIPPALPRTQTMPAIPAVAPVVAPVAPKAATPVFNANANELEDGGARAVEVAAMLGESVVSVKHCMEPRGGKVTRATWAFAAGGVAALLASGIAFYDSVSTAADNKARFQQHVAMGKPAKAFRNELVGTGTDVVAFAGLLGGLVGLTTALARSRRERKHPGYRIGTAAGVEMAIEQAPAASFPMIAPKGDDFVFNYGTGMDGELTVDNTTLTFAELVAQGRAKASTTTAGAFELAIPAKARIRARAGQTTFLVTAVSKPREQAAPLFQLENRTLAYGAGSLAAHLAVVALLYSIPVADAGVNVDLASMEDGRIRSATTENEDMVHEREQSTESGEGGQSDPSTAMALAEGEAGDPKKTREGQMEMKKRTDDDQHMARQQAIEYARTAGVLGSTRVIEGSIASLTSNLDWSNGWSDADIYGGLKGEPGGGRGKFGGGRSGDGPGGGCFGMECGTVGTNYNRIRINTRPGDDWGGPRDGWGKPRIHVGGVPPGGDPPRIKGDLDRAIIKRYIKRNHEKFAYCYESELLAKPGIEGSVMVSFLISGSGTVQQSVGTGFDGKVATCVANIVKNIEFPAPTDGGNVQVNYPFTFHAAGAQK